MCMDVHGTSRVLVAAAHRQVARGGSERERRPAGGSNAAWGERHTCAHVHNGANPCEWRCQAPRPQLTEEAEGLCAAQRACESAQRHALHEAVGRCRGRLQWSEGAPGSAASGDGRKNKMGRRRREPGVSGEA